MAASVRENKNYKGKDIEYYSNAPLPAQMLPMSSKTEAWRQACVDAIIGMSSYAIYNGRPSKYKKQVNYNLINSIFDDRDIEYVTDPYQIYGGNINMGGSPARAEMFNIIRPKLEVLKGEEIKRPFNFKVIGLAGEILTVRDKKKKDALRQALISKIQTPLTTEEVDNQGNPVMDPMFEQIIQDFNYNYEDTREQVANKLLKVLWHKLQLELRFNKGFEHALATAEEIYYVGIVSGNPVVRTVNNLRFDYDKNPDLERIQEAQWCKEERYMGIGQILDEFRQYLSEEEIERLDKNNIGSGLSAPQLDTDYYGANSITYTNDIYSGAGSLPPYSGNRLSTYNGTHILVNTVCWRSMTEIYFLKITVDGEDPINTIVDTDFEIPKKAKKIKNDDGSSTYKWMDNAQVDKDTGETVPAIFYELEKQWINQIWEGTKIGNDIYVKIQPIENQIVSLDNPSEIPLPYIGRIYNATNSQAVSLVDLLKPIQYTHIIVWYRLMTELAKAKGKKMLMDLAAIPKSQGMDLEKWMYYYDTVGIAFLNSHEEGTEGSSTGKPSTFNQYQAIDLSLSNVVAQYMQVIDKLEEMAGDITGINRQRQGSTFSSETVGGIERAVAQSSYITESIFYYHNEVKRDVLEYLIRVAKLAYKDGKKFSYMFNERERMFLDIDGEMLNDSEYGVFITNGAKENQAFEAVKQLAQAALQNQMIKFSDIVKIYKSNSISELENMLTESEDKQAAQAQQELQQRQQELQMQLEANAQEAEAQRQFDADQAQKDRDNKINVAQVQALGFNEDKDINDNNVPDVLEFEKLKLKQQEISAKAITEQSKLQQKQQEENTKNKIDLKKHEDNIKLEKEKSKNKLRETMIKAEAQKQAAKSKAAKANTAKKK